jgi:hypothetical protein
MSSFFSFISYYLIVSQFFYLCFCIRKKPKATLKGKAIAKRLKLNVVTVAAVPAATAPGNIDPGSNIGNFFNRPPIFWIFY